MLGFLGRSLLHVSADAAPPGFEFMFVVLNLRNLDPIILAATSYLALLIMLWFLCKEQNFVVGSAIAALTKTGV